MERKRWPSIIIAMSILLQLCGAQYVTQVSLNYKLVYILRLVYICTVLLNYNFIFPGVSKRGSTQYFT